MGLRRHPHFVKLLRNLALLSENDSLDRPGEETSRKRNGNYFRHARPNREVVIVRLQILPKFIELIPEQSRIQLDWKCDRMDR